MNKIGMYLIVTGLAVAAILMTNIRPLNSQPPSKTSTENSSPIQFKAKHARFTEFFGSIPKVEIIADGFLWSEGPLWIEADGGYLLFTDVPGNKIYKWSRENGLNVLLEPSGGVPNSKIFREPGANGLNYDATAKTILVANHGLRAVIRLDLQTLTHEIIADSYNGKKFNSPNDLVRAADGSIYFTDPPYGLKGLDTSPYKELSFNGVYKISPSGEVTLLTDRFTRPNGIALSPDETTLYIANSDPKSPTLTAFPLKGRGIDDQEATVFLEASSAVKDGALGLPDGMAIDTSGNIFATGPGGIYVFTPIGDLIGIIHTGTANANCAIGEGGKALYIAAHDKIIRIEFNGTTKTGP